MEKLVYITAYQLPTATESENNGVIKKIWNQYKIFQQSYDTYLIGYFGEEIGLLHNDEITVLSKSGSKGHRRFKLYAAAKKFAQSNPASFYYVRYGFSDASFISMLRTIKSMEALVILEIPTYPYTRDFYKDRLVQRMIMRPLDYYYRKKLNRYVDRIVTFSEDKEIFSIPCMNIVNGICVNEVPVRKPESHPNVIHLVGVASMRNFHGYDRVIDGMHEYYKNGGKKRLVFHVVGEGPELTGYKKLVKNHHLEEQVIFHGFLAGQKLDEIFNMSDIAVECLGCHRNHIYLESSLKSREYAAKGLPFISSCKIDVFPEDYPYLLNAPGDESPLDMGKVIGFCQEIYEKESVQTVIQNMRSYALSHCDMKNVMKPILDYYQISAE